MNKINNKLDNDKILFNNEIDTLNKKNKSLINLIEKYENEKNNQSHMNVNDDIINLNNKIHTLELKLKEKTTQIDE